MKFQFITESYEIGPAGNLFASGEFTLPENIKAIQPPAYLKATRITFQVNSKDYSNANAFEILVSSSTPQNAADGYKILCLFDGALGVAIPGSFTVESMNGEVPLNSTFYIANTGTDRCMVTVIYEGFYE